VSAAPVEKLETGVVNLQALTALFSTNPKVYGTVSAGVVVALIVLLAVGLHGLGENPMREWVGVAAVSILTLVLAYHRSYDMRMVMLTLPALALLWRRAPKMAAVVSFLSCFLLYSTALKMVNRLSPHLTHAQTHSLIFRLLIERQQALFVFFTAIAWVAVPFLLRRMDAGVAAGAGARRAGVDVAA
jgi:ABC-type Fe3+-siderophore transport system permease subunit